jgi:hypothetical protein
MDPALVVEGAATGRVLPLPPVPLFILSPQKPFAITSLLRYYTKLNFRIPSSK